MIRALLHRYVTGFERKYDYDAAYLHELADISTRDFYRFARVQMMLQSKDHAPRDALQAAAIGGALVEDCGPCVQIASDRAVEEGMSGEVIAALLSGRPANADAQLGFDYARALLTGSENLDALRETIEGRWGKRGVMALTFMAMAARNFPVIKRALGHAKSCQKVRVAGVDIAVQQSLKAA
ncbi:MAG TPA: hypothetical protein VHE09_00875 [Rhizomicrobium sp.]|jgi:hypothetical protein|nr:hypothetical protein [Rhizomicrobium sp.]